MKPQLLCPCRICCQFGGAEGAARGTGEESGGTGSPVLTPHWLQSCPAAFPLCRDGAHSGGWRALVPQELRGIPGYLCWWLFVQLPVSSLCLWQHSSVLGLYLCQCLYV